MRRLERALPDALPREEVLRRARAQRVLRRWSEIVGEGLAARSSPERYDHGTVWVAVTGASWAQELRMLKSQILSRMTQMSGEIGLFRDVRFGVRRLPPRQEADVSAAKTISEEDDPRRGLSIREIAERRIRLMTGETRD
ncbi:MAG: DUF721 domain-containing protein [Fimbriimonadaceae bacterium]